MRERSSDLVRVGYPKSTTTRAAILAAALADFGENGFAGATTRAIAQASGVALPAIAYHFGSKEGLYLACADEIVARYRSVAGGFAERAAILWKAGQPEPEVCRTLLAETLGIVLRLFLEEEGFARANFATRELRDRGLAFGILYEQLWAPGVGLVAQLVAGIRGVDAVTPAERADALLLLSSLLAFAIGRDVSLRILGFETPEAAAVDFMEGAINRSLARL